jgi:hypothetical protein
MIAALATLVFLVTLWMLVVVGAAMLDASGSRVLAALKGTTAEPVLRTRPVRLRPHRLQPRRAAPVTLRQRAAA